MNVSVENLGPCKKLLRVEVSVEKVTKAFDEVTSQFTRQAQLPGFRPGKAPRHLVAKNFESRIQEDTRRRLFEESYREAAQEQKLRILTTLDVEEQSFGRGQPFGYTVTLEHAPEFELPTYKGLSAKRETAAVSDADVDRALTTLREQQVKYNEVTRPAQTGDVVVVHYAGTCEGKPLTDFNPTARGLTEKRDTWMLIAEGFFIPGFTEQLVGATAGDKRTVKVTFPEGFVIAELVGKEGVYEVEVTSVREKILPELNDEFAKSLGASDLEQLRQGVRRDLQNELNFRAKRAVRDQLLRQLLEPLTFDLPESVLATETRNLVYNIVNENQQRGIAKELIEEKKNEIFQSAQNSARDRVKAAFVLNRIAEIEKIGVDRQEIAQRITLLAQQNQMAPDKMVKVLQERNAFPEIQQDILTGKVLDWLELNAKVEEVPAAAAPAA
ncbi:MAG: trigger factor [Verrucomicrobiales bacterium]|nr:trigger factor [Verrucomicrobiales bacterium]